MIQDRTALEKTSARIRARLVELSHQAGAPHLGGSLSCVDALVALYWGVLRIDPARPDDPDRDRFILSKGHAAPALYTTLAARGFFSDELLSTFGQPGGRLPEQPSPGALPGVEAATGSLGHGLPIGVGLAIAARLHDRPYRVFCLLSDGECNEGSTWEAAMMAPARGLERLTALVDFNGWQATDRSREVMALEPLGGKFASFGWEVHEVDGHDLGRLLEVLSAAPPPGKPRAVVMHTVKGRGVSFMEDDNNWHYRIPSAEEVNAAREELGVAG